MLNTCPILRWKGGALHSQMIHRTVEIFQRPDEFRQQPAGTPQFNEMSSGRHTGTPWGNESRSRERLVNGLASRVAAWQQYFVSHAPELRI
jgi:hypothetical protein